MVLDTAKPKNRQSTIQLGMRGRDAAKELTLMVNISKVFTIALSGWTEQKCMKERSTNWQKKITRTIFLQRNSKDTKDNGISP